MTQLRREKNELEDELHDTSQNLSKMTRKFKSLQVRIHGMVSFKLANYELQLKFEEQTEELQSTRSDLNRIKTELENIRAEKVSYDARIKEMKDKLREEKQSRLTASANNEQLREEVCGRGVGIRTRVSGLKSLTAR